MSTVVRTWRESAGEEVTTSNSVGDPHFRVVDINTGSIVNLSFKWDCSEAKIVYGQLLFLKGKVSRGYADESNRIVPSSISAAKTEVIYIQKICEYWHKFHADRTLRSLSLAETQIMIRALMLSANNKDQVMSRSVLGTICVLLSRSSTLYNKGMIFDGFQFVVNKKFKKDVMAPLLKGLNLEYEEWIEGGTYGSIPLTCASIILNEAISIIESEEAKLAQVFFESWRKTPCAPVLWFDNGKGFDRLKAYREWQKNKSIDRVIKPETYASFISFGELADERCNEKFHCLPWSNLTELGDFCELIMKAGLAIILLLSAFRINEVQKMDISDFYQDNDGSWWFKTVNTKTERGVMLPRSLHGMAAQAATVIKNLCAVDIEKHNVPLFHCGFRGNAFNATLKWGGWTPEKWLVDCRYAKNTLSYWFSQFYLKQIIPKFPDIILHHRSVSPHQARHTFAEFAIRRFDGNILPKLREHYRHVKGSYQMRRYTKNKLSDSVKMSLERDYLEEVMHRVAKGSLEDRFHGPAAKRLQRELKAVSVYTYNELTDFIKKHADLFVRFTAFEWGFCALRKDEEYKAKCIDPPTGLPKIDVNSCPELCCGCVHNMNNDLQCRSLERIAIAHQNIADTHPLDTIKKMSADVVKIIRRRLKQK
jgi:integrase